MYGVPERSRAYPSIPAEVQVLEELAGVGVADTAAEKIMAAMGTRSLDDLAQLLGSDNEAVSDLRRLFQLAEAYGMADWLAFDASVVRGLSYYTGQALRQILVSTSLHTDICGSWGCN